VTQPAQTLTARKNTEGCGLPARWSDGDRPRRRASPYRLIVSDDQCKTLAQGEVRHFESMIYAANAFVKAAEPFKTVIYDDGCEARHLNGDEQRLLENVCNMLGLDVEEVGA
jgi:hypothetical protein